MPKVRFKDDDLEVDAEVGSNLKEVAQAEGSSIPFGCEQGVCGTCLVNIVEGEDNVSDPTDQEKETLAAMGAEPGQRLACQCQIDGDVTIESAH
ncbi:MAG TPA: 2Fe-2S iron-sulfur cluster-binding protein [Patescibacteria group bacterium]|nr:2Fe-2S iron-sulfur cluster-binding protein [Patescibacteria group bacterium]